jgi:large subunit ribosomal protein L29
VVKAEDLRTLDGEELTSRLRTSRRELYELRFKLAVGQLDDHRQIRKVRKDIARILTVVHARRLGEPIAVSSSALAIEPLEGAGTATAVAEPEVVEAATEEPALDATPEDVETAVEPAGSPAEQEGVAEQAPAPKTSRRRRAAGEDGND